MAKTTQTTETIETTQLTPADALRNGWLAYLGLYGAAYERVKPLTEKTAGIFEELIVKGEKVEANAQDAAEDVRTRANSFYGDNFAGIRKFFPEFVAKSSRVDDLEAEIEALNKKVAALTKKPATKRTSKTAEKAA